jgi:hypothetical protein
MTSAAADNIFVFNACADNWVISDCEDSDAQDFTNGSNSRSSSEGGQGNQQQEEDAQYGVRVRLIDFGRALSARQYRIAAPTELAPQSARKGGRETSSQQRQHSDDQAQLFASLYPDLDPSDGGGGVDHFEPVQYAGDVSCKGFQCTEMQRDQPWSYQVKHTSLVLRTV